MSNLLGFGKFSDAAMAAYADDVTNNSNTDPQLEAVGFTESGIARFRSEFEVLAVAPDDISGFQAMLLQDKATGEKVIAIRGTDFPEVNDLITDLNIVLAVKPIEYMRQFNRLEKFYQEMVETGKIGANEQIAVTEPRRDSRRLHNLRGFSYGYIEAVFSGSAGACRTAGGCRRGPTNILWNFE